MKPTMMPGNVPMSTALPPTMGPAAIGGTSGPVRPVAPSAGASAAPSAKFNPDNKLPAAAFHKPGVR